MKRWLFFLVFSCSISSLPAQVVLLAFEGEQLGTGIRISWTIGQGNTCADLEIEHSTDGVSFSQVFLYPGVCGNANFDQSYSYTHPSPKENALNYYRIRSASQILSHVIEVRFIAYGAAGYTLFPQPATGSATLLVDNPSNSRLVLQLLDLRGQQVSEIQETQSGRFTVLRPQTGAGVYLFRVTKENGEEIRGRLLFL